MSKIEITAATINDLARALAKYKRSSSFLSDEIAAGEGILVKKFAIASFDEGKPFCAMLIDGRAYVLELPREDVKTWLDAFDCKETAHGA